MQENNIVNKVFYVVRICGKEKLNEKRLQSYENAIHAIQEQCSFNNLIKVDQPCKPNERAKKYEGQTNLKEQQRFSGGNYTATNTKKMSYRDAAKQVPSYKRWECEDED